MKGAVLFLFSLTFVATIALNFLAIGDWGGNDVPPYYTEAQADTSKGMNKIASNLQAQFILALGDNFYYAGVTSETDQRFHSTFENVYTGDALQVNWYVIAGNHDHEGNTDAQIQYSGDSARWKFPSLFHRHSFKTTDGLVVDIIMIDTVELASKTDKAENEEGYFDPLPLKSKEHAQDYWAWIESALEKSKDADFIIVAGHYPVYSICDHGSTATLIEHLRPLLIQYGAHYLSGHDHCMEHLVEPNANVNYFLSGMGVECCYDPSNLNTVPSKTLKWYIASNNKNSTTGGFTSFQASKSGLRAIYYDQHGNKLYTAPLVSART